MLTSIQRRCFLVTPHLAVLPPTFPPDPSLGKLAMSYRSFDAIISLIRALQCRSSSESVSKAPKPFHIYSCRYS